MKGKTNKKKKFQKVVSVFCAVLLVISALFYPQPAKASAGNPYLQTYSDGEGYHPGNCTWQVWEEAYTRLGIQLPNWGNAGGWCDRARAAGYTVVDYTDGAVPPSDCIIEWNGHVAWVLSADAVGANIREGNIKLNGAYQAVHEQWWSWQQLRKYRGNPRGFIILNGGGVGNVNVSYSNLHTTFVDTWNVGLYGEINNPSRLTVSEVGVQIWDSAGTLVVNHREGCGLNNSLIKQELNVVGEALPSGLRSGETYTWKMFAVANGNTCESGTERFTIVDDRSPVISNIKIMDISSEGYTVSCTVTDNYHVEKVQFPTWTDVNGQDDIQKDWGSNPKAAGTKNGDIYTFRVNISEHNNESGLYHTHIYAWDKAGNQAMDIVPDIKVEPAPATPAPFAPSTEIPSVQPPDITLAPATPVPSPTLSAEIPSVQPSDITPAPATIVPSFVPSTEIPSVQPPNITPEPADSQSVNLGYPIVQSLTDKSATLKYVIPSQYMTGWGMYFGTDPSALEHGFGGNPNRNISTMQWDRFNLLPNTTYYYYFYYSSGIKTVASKLFSFTTDKTNGLSGSDFNSVTTKEVWDDGACFDVSIPPQNLKYWGYYLGTDLTNMKGIRGGNNFGYLISEMSLGIHDLTPDTMYYFYIYYVTESKIVLSRLYNFKTNSASGSNNNNVKPAIAVPEKVVLFSVDSFKKKSMFVTWYSTDEVNGYQLQYATNKKFKSSKSIMINSQKIETKTISKLKSKKKYYVRIRAYKFDGGKKKLYGKWSVVKSCKIK